MEINLGKKVIFETDINKIIEDQKNEEIKKYNKINK